MAKCSAQLDCADWASRQNPGWDAYLTCSPGLLMRVVVLRAAQFSHCHIGLLGLYGSAGVAIVPCWCCLRKDSLLSSNHLIHLVDDESLWPTEMKTLAWLHAYCGRIVYVGWRWREVPGLLVLWCDLPASTSTTLHYPCPSASLLSLDQEEKPEDYH